MEKVNIIKIHEAILFELLCFKKVNTTYITCLYLSIQGNKIMKKNSKSFKFLFNYNQIIFSEEMGEYVFKYVNMLFNKYATDFAKNVRENFILMNTLQARYIPESMNKYQKKPNSNITNCVLKTFENVLNQTSWYKENKKVSRDEKKIKDATKLPFRNYFDKELVKKKLIDKMIYYDT